MRGTCWIMTLVLGLLALGLLAPARVRAVRVAPPAPPAPPGAPVRLESPSPSWTVSGTWMKTGDEALDDALQKAQIEVIAYLRKQTPPVEWVPSLPYIQTHLLRAPWQEEQRVFEDLGQMYQVKLTFEIGAADLQEMQERGREIRVHRRLYWVGKWLLGLVAVLGATAGFLRLDERTRGFYTGWLRLAAIGFAGAVLGGLLLWA